jgi:glutamate synthase (ferredoxin)
VAFLLDEHGDLERRVNRETVAIESLSTTEQEALLKALLEAHLEATGSARAAQVLADWPSWKSRFKLLVPPSEKVAMGLAPREAVVARPVLNADARPSASAPHRRGNCCG